MSASKFRDVINNGTVSSSDDSKKKITTVFSGPISQNKVYCGAVLMGGGIFKRKVCFPLPI